MDNFSKLWNCIKYDCLPVHWQLYFMRDDTPTLVFHNKSVNKKNKKNKYMVSGSLKFSLNHFGDEA